MLLELPAELLHDILSRLELLDRKRFRLVSNECERLATPLVFSELPFDLQPGGCYSLASVANSRRLNPHLRVIRFVRREGLTPFNTFRQWEDANVHQYVTSAGEIAISSTQSDIPLKSKAEWDSLSEAQRESLFSEYKDELKTYNAHAWRLIEALSNVLSPGLRTNAQVEVTDAEQTLHTYKAAVETLSKVHSFAHTPAFKFGRWRKTWRDIAFHPEALFHYNNVGQEYPDIEAVQLFIALSIAFSASDLLRSVKMCTFSSAFWGTRNLCRLFSRKRWRYVDGSGPYMGFPPEDPTLVQESVDKCVRWLVTFEHGFSGLTHLECRVDTHYFDNLRSLPGGITNVLKEAVNLEHLHIVFRGNVMFDCDRSYMKFLAGNFKPTPREPDYPDELVGESKSLLVDPGSAMGNLRRLRLSLKTTAPHLDNLVSRLQHLRHLALVDVVLIPSQGQWETVLESVACHLNLYELNLSSLKDVKEGRRRLILNPYLPIWKTCDTDGMAYREYEAAIIDFGLKRSNSFPLLDPFDFISSRGGDVGRGHMDQV